MLNLWRRHLAGCTYRDKGRAHTKCACPIWVDGDLKGKRVRQSLDTRDWQRAIRTLGRMEDPDAYSLGRARNRGVSNLSSPGCDRHTRALSAAVASFHEATHDLAHGTIRNYKRALRFLEEFLTKRGIVTVEEVELDALNAYRASRPISSRTWLKELEILRHFFRHCVDNERCLRNPAEKLQAPKNLKPADREPYTSNEITKIIAAYDGIGQAPYERLRARAMILALRYTALRISDVATLERDRIRGGEIFVRTTKNGKVVKLPVHADLQAAPDRLPIPRGATGPDCRYFF